MFHVQKGWKRIKRDAKLENFRLYDCRHTFASKLVTRGIDLYAVSELVVNTGKDNLEDCVQQVLDMLTKRGILS